MRKIAAAASLALLLLLGTGRDAPAVAPVDPVLFSFPGSVYGPASAASAGTALADRWLGDRPFDNPALAPRRMVELSPAIVWVSRQDLRASNRNFDDQAPSFDAAGGWLGVPLGRVVLFAYASQPVLRLEGNAFTRGNQAVDPVNPPATIHSETESREIRAGGGLSWGGPAFRAGLAGEWTRRDDRYVVGEESGAPLAGTRTTTFSGEAVGGQAGVRIARGAEGRHPLVIGAGVRYRPRIPLSIEDSFTFALNDSTVGDTIPGERTAGWEGGVSARVGLGPTFSALGSVGSGTAQEWTGLGARSGATLAWSLGGEFHDPETPWTVRFGLGQEHQAHAPEFRAGVIGIGVGWDLEGTRIEGALIRRSLTRTGSPTSFDERAVASVGVSF